jgi:hypothetical protein
VDGWMGGWMDGWMIRLVPQFSCLTPSTPAESEARYCLHSMAPTGGLRTHPISLG